MLLLIFSVFTVSLAIKIIVLIFIPACEKSGSIVLVSWVGMVKGRELNNFLKDTQLRGNGAIQAKAANSRFYAFSILLLPPSLQLN